MCDDCSASKRGSQALPAGWTQAELCTFADPPAGILAVDKFQTVQCQEVIVALQSQPCLHQFEIVQHNA